MDKSPKAQKAFVKAFFFPKPISRRKQKRVWKSSMAKLDNELDRIHGKDRTNRKKV